MVLKSANLKKEPKWEKDNELVNMYAKVKGYCYALSGNKWDGEDLAQECFFKAMKNYEGNAINQTLLKRIAHNTWIDKVRKQKNETLEEVPEPLARKSSTKEHLIEMADELIEKLTRKQLFAFVLKEAFQFKISEIADFLEMKESAVKGLLLRSRSKLREESTHSKTSVHHFNYEQYTYPDEFSVVLVEALRSEDPSRLIKLIPKMINTKGMKQIYSDKASFTCQHASNYLLRAA
ncbi:sigma-70 family RNA polymerase sigma factor [Evansella tamaricis]|uniref:Sigma-70 family RNA polymerase sigma factor n=1 Tax=Evansella tamaricis TaxID=2069301 RepID=A0ABS6JG36_9BACI|nr:sigma-70 family RNA polymerase sigma factor [Evansella tamaricis]MBU9712488.1 sigma-70 family RNA polymerase sigma factor [Evansella tamaricis]